MRQSHTNAHCLHRRLFVFSVFRQYTPCTNAPPGTAKADHKLVQCCETNESASHVTCVQRLHLYYPRAAPADCAALPPVEVQLARCVAVSPRRPLALLSLHPFAQSDARLL